MKLITRDKGVYIIRPKNPFHYWRGFFYIGMTTRSFQQRHKEHLKALREGSHASKRMQRYVERYGIDSVYMKPIERLEDLLSIRNSEAKAIRKRKPAWNSDKPAFVSDPFTTFWVCSTIWLMILVISHL